MATALPYLSSYKNLDKFFEGIASAKVPDAVSQRFLAETLGLKSKTDRGLIALIKQLGFVDGSGHPTATYPALKNPSKARAAMADAIRAAYAPLFAANERAQELSNEELKGLVAQVAGTDGAMTNKIAGTFNGLKKRADFGASAATEASPVAVAPAAPLAPAPSRGLEPTSFHFNIQVHLPANASEDAYVSIFSAIKRVFS